MHNLCLVRFSQFKGIQIIDKFRTILISLFPNSRINQVRNLTLNRINITFTRVEFLEECILILWCQVHGIHVCLETISRVDTILFVFNLHEFLNFGLKRFDVCDTLVKLVENSILLCLVQFRIV